MVRQAKQKERRKALGMMAGGAGLMAAAVVGFLFPYITVTTAQDWSLLEEQAGNSYASPGTVLPGQVVTSTPEPDIGRRDHKDRLVIGSIGVDMPVYEGRDSDVLLKGGWLFPGTALPGRPGNSVIFGHRFRYLPPVSNTFYRLDKLAVGETFTMTYDGESFTYRVIGTSTVEPTDFSVLEQDTGKKWMTLITCAPAFSTRYRLIVLAELVE